MNSEKNDTGKVEADNPGQGVVCETNLHKFVIAPPRSGMSIITNEKYFKNIFHVKASGHKLL